MRRWWSLGSWNQKRSVSSHSLEFNGTLTVFPDGSVFLLETKISKPAEPGTVGKGSVNSLPGLLGVMGSRAIPTFTPWLLDVYFLPSGAQLHMMVIDWEHTLNPRGQCLIQTPSPSWCHSFVCNRPFHHSSFFLLVLCEIRWVDPTALYPLVHLLCHKVGYLVWPNEMRYPLNGSNTLSPQMQMAVQAGALQAVKVNPIPFMHPLCQAWADRWQWPADVNWSSRSILFI